jgi:recombination protein RecT
VSEEAKIEKRPPTQVEFTLSKIMESRDAIAAALGSREDVDRFLETARQAYLTNPTPLIQCEPRSVVRCLHQIAALQLSPDPRVGDCYLIPRRNKEKNVIECTLLVGYIGLSKRIRRSPEVLHVDAAVVYENDKFSYRKGAEPKLEHEPTLGERGKVIASYAIAMKREGPPLFWVCSRADIDAARARSQQPHKAWKTDFDAMAMKTAIRRLPKLMPLDDVWQAQLQEEEHHEAEAIQTVRQVGPREAAPLEDLDQRPLVEAEDITDEPEEFDDFAEFAPCHPDAEPPDDWKPEEAP